MNKNTFIVAMLGTTIASAAVTIVSTVSKYYHGKKSCKISKEDSVEISNSADIKRITDDYKIAMKCYDILSEVFDDVKKGDLIRATALLDVVDTMNRNRDSEIAHAVLFWRESIERQKKMNAVL